MSVKTRKKEESAPIVEVPVLIVATSPFTNIVLDKKDYLNATLEQANRNTYDRLKICRTTLVIDAGLPNNMGAIVSYTGAFLFPHIKGVDKNFVINAVNQILLQLTFAGVYCDSVSPEDVGYGTLYETGYFMAGGGASGVNYSLLVALQHQDASTFDTIQLVEPRTYTSKQFKENIRKGMLITKKIPEINASLFLDGITHYRKLQLASALVFLWSTTEFLIGRIWEEKILPRGINIFGRAKFIESNAWQAAHKVEALFQVGIIREVLYEKLNKARSARNRLAHKGETPSLVECEKGLESTFALISLIVTDYADDNKFSALINDLKQYHKPDTGPLKPKYWREIPAVPGDRKWGEKPYPRHPEIELKPLINAKLSKKGN